MSTEEDKRRRSVRLRGFDYAFRGFFFVTICTHNKKPTLGKIMNYKSQLSDIGKIVEKCWREIPEHFPKVYLDEWIIMPNHIHGIIVIKFPLGHDASSRATACRAPTPVEPLSIQHESKLEGFGRPVKASLPTIVRSFKSAATKNVREWFGLKVLPVWQRNYFEHVIRNEESFNRIRNYIWENPIHWNTDEYYRR